MPSEEYEVIMENTRGHESSLLYSGMHEEDAERIKKIADEYMEKIFGVGKSPYRIYIEHRVFNQQTCS